MATSKEKLYQKRYDAQERKIRRMMEKFSKKYGRNWTKFDLTPAENRLFLSTLRQQKRAIDALVKIDVETGRLKRK